MNCETRYEPDGDYVSICIEGALDGRVVRKMLHNWLSIASRENCLRSLADFTAAKMAVASHDQMHEFAARLEKFGVERDMTMAAVVREDVEDHWFFEIVTRARGFHYRIFNNRDDALAWLASR